MPPMYPSSRLLYVKGHRNLRIVVILVLKKPRHEEPGYSRHSYQASEAMKKSVSSFDSLLTLEAMPLSSDSLSTSEAE